MKKTVLKIVGLALLMVAPYSFAHSGHDHGHWTSGVIHALWIGALFIIVGFAIKRVLANKQNQPEEG